MIAGEALTTSGVHILRPIFKTGARYMNNCICFEFLLLGHGNLLRQLYKANKYLFIYSKSNRDIKRKKKHMFVSENKRHR